MTDVMTLKLCQKLTAQPIKLDTKTFVFLTPQDTVLQEKYVCFFQIIPISLCSVCLQIPGKIDVSLTVREKAFY